jgi:hypothetical protein
MTKKCIFETFHHPEDILNLVIWTSPWQRNTLLNTIPSATMPITTKIKRDEYRPKYNKTSFKMSDNNNKTKSDTNTNYTQNQGSMPMVDIPVSIRPQKKTYRDISAETTKNQTQINGANSKDNPACMEKNIKESETKIKQYCTEMIKLTKDLLQENINTVTYKIDTAQAETRIELNSMKEAVT